MKEFVLSENQFAVAKAEFETGNVLKNDGTIFISGSSELDMYDIFNNLETAKSFAKLKVENNPKIECWIINSSNEVIFCWDINGERSV